VCGETDPTMLDFHHRRGEVKEFSMSDAITAAMKWEKIVVEANKCVLLCSNHHRLLHCFESLGIL